MFRRIAAAVKRSGCRPGTLPGLLSGLLTALIAAPAPADCGGADLMAALERDRPAVHREILARAAATANGQGRFWRVERAGAAPSFLFGTFHDTAVGAEDLPPEVAAALDGARLMLVELTDAEKAAMQARMARDPAFVIVPEGNGIIERLSADERAAAGRRLAARGMTLPVAGRLRPWMLFSALALPACMIREARLGKPILDDALARRAEAAGVKVAGLETYRQALGALTALPEEDMAAMVLDLLRSPQDEEDVWFTTASLYRAGELAAIWEFSRAEAETTLGGARSAEVFGRFRQALLTERNRAWMERLAPAVAEGGVFAAFGALHLVGEDGIVALLRGRGFTVTRAD